MRIFGFLLVSAQSNSIENFVKGCDRDCVWKVRDREECQLLCDKSEFCDVWALRKSDRICYTKKREGWTVEHHTGFESGFKNAGPWYDPNTLFRDGNYCC